MANPTLVELFQDIADEIREKRKDLETTDLLVAANFPEEIRKIVTDPSGDVTATASDILYGKTACISGDGSITTGTMPNNGAVSKVLTTQNSYYTIPKGYHDGTGKVAATLTDATLTSSVSLSSTSVSSSLTSTTSTFSSIINAAKSVGTTTVPSSGVYVKVIHKPAITSVSATPSVGVSEEGYVSTSSSNTGMAKSVTIKAASDLYIPIITSSATTPTTTITKEPSITLSSGSIKASYTGGQNITPTVPNAGWVAGGTAGYVTTTGTKTLALTEDNLVTLAGEASVKSGTGTITVGAPEYDSTNTNFTVSASLAIPAPSVESEGYISDNKGTKTANSASGSLTLAKVGLGATISNGGASTPVISRTAKPTDDTWVDAASGDVTTTKPTSGPYVQVDVVAATKKITATPKVSSDGYGTKSYYSSSNATAIGGHNKATTAYVPITVATTQPTLSGATTTWSTGWVTGGKTVVPTATTAAGVLSLSPNGTQTSAPTKNSDGKYQFSATANMTATSVGTGYVTSKTITSADSKGVTFTMDAATLSSSVTHAKGTPTITTYTAAATGYTNAVESATLETSAPPSGVYAKVNVSGSLTSGSVKHSIGKAGYAPTSLTDTQTVTATINSTDRYIKIKEGSISRGTLSLSSGTGTITTAPTLSGSNYIFKTTATLTNTTVGAGWLPASTSGSDSQSVTFSMPKAIVTVKPTSGNIQPTLSRGSKGTSETWTNADDTSGSVILNGTTPTSGVYIKVYSESNSTKQAGTAGYTNTVGYTPAVTSISGKVDVTTNLQSSVLYVPVTTGTITSGSLSLANATASGSLTVPSQSGSSYVFKATATLTAPKVSKAGWLTTQTITSGSNDSITFTMPTAVISNNGSTAAKVSATLTPASKDSSSTETWVDAYNSSGTITTNTAPTDKTPYIKISAGGTQTAGTGYYYVSTAGYTPKTSNKSISVNASVTGITKYIPIKTSSVTLPSSLSKNPTLTSHVIDTTTGTVTATFSNSGTVAVATSMSAAGWVASAPSGNVSISGTNTSKLELGIASVTVNPVSGTIKPTLNRGTKGSSETWTDASDTTSTYTSAPSSGVYVKVYSTANSSITAGSANYTNTAGYITAHTSGQGSKDVTTNLQSSTIFVPIKTTTPSGTKITTQDGFVTIDPGYITSKTTIKASITSGSVSATSSLTFADKTSNTTITPTWTVNSDGTAYTSSLSAAISKTSLKAGYFTAQDIVSAKTITHTLSIAAAKISTSGASISITPSIASNISSISGCTNAAASATLVSSVTSGNVYVPVTISGSNSGNASYSATAGYLPATPTTNISSSASIKNTTQYVQINKSNITAKTITSQNDTYTVPTGYVTSATTITAAINNATITTPTSSITTGITTKGTPTKDSSGTITIPINASGTKGTVSISVSKAGYVSSITGGAATASFTGSVSLTKAELQTLEPNLAGANILSGKSIFGVSGTITGILDKTNTFTHKNYFSFGSVVGSSSTEGTITIGDSSLPAGLVAHSGIKGEKVYNAVWNDLADLIPVDADCELEFGKCYCFDGEKYYKSTKYLDDGIIGIHSDVAGFEMGHKKDAKELKCSVAGFVLAYVDREYPVGTLLTCTEDGYLTEIKKEDKINYPEKIVGSYWKGEKEEYWGSEQRKVLVNGRKWVKVR